MAKDNGFLELKKQIKENSLKNIYLFFGDELFIKEIYIKKLREMLLTEMKKAGEGKAKILPAVIAKSK